MLLCSVIVKCHCKSISFVPFRDHHFYANNTLVCNDWFWHKLANTARDALLTLTNKASVWCFKLYSQLSDSF